MHYVFADEAGNFDFSQKGSAYFIVASVVLDDWTEVTSELIKLRHDLAWERSVELREEGFHATDDKQSVRDKVFGIIQRARLTVDAVILDKRKTYAGIAANESYFYKLAWHYLFQYVRRESELEDCLVIASSLGTKAKRTAFKSGLETVIDKYKVGRVSTAFWQASSHPCLQIADYCAWAIQRKYERGDTRSFVLLDKQLRSCFEPFKDGTKLYY